MAAALGGPEARRDGPGALWLSLRRPAAWRTLALSLISIGSCFATARLLRLARSWWKCRRSGGGTEAEVDKWKALRKTRPCRWHLAKGTCYYGEQCVFAHCPEELRKPEWAKALAAAPHWQGEAVAIGVIETAMFSDLPPPGTLDVVCNRVTCLGNPFCAWYARPEDRPPLDEEGWAPLEHQRLCAAFEDYLGAVLSGDGPGEGHEALVEVARGIGEKHGLKLAETWLVQRLARADVMLAFGRLQDLMAAGVRLRLLCHCRPHVRCHAELLKRRLDARPPPAAAGGADAAAEMRALLRTPQANWPTTEGPGPKCAQCGRQARALDPGTRKVYCCFCWLEFADTVAWRATEFAKARRQGRALPES